MHDPSLSIAKPLTRCVARKERDKGNGYGPAHQRKVNGKVVFIGAGIQPFIPLLIPFLHRLLLLPSPYLFLPSSLYPGSAFHNLGHLPLHGLNFHELFPVDMRFGFHG